MDTYSIAEAKAQLSKLIRRAGAGRDVVITRHGKPVARIRPATEPRTGVRLEDLKENLARQRLSKVSSAKILRRLRDQE